MSKKERELVNPEPNPTFAIIEVSGTLGGGFNDLLTPGVFGDYQIDFWFVDQEDAAKVWARQSAAMSLAEYMGKELGWKSFIGRKCFQPMTQWQKETRKDDELPARLKARGKVFQGKGKPHCQLPVVFEDGTPVTDGGCLQHRAPVRITFQFIPFAASFGYGVSARLLKVVRLADGGEPEE